MSLESTPGFKIVSSALKKGEGIHYDLILTETSNVAGTADIIFTSLDSYGRDTRYGPLLEKGLDDTDKIANMTYFHPYEAYEHDLDKLSKPIKEAAPEALYNMILNDSSKHECKAIIAMTWKGGMKAFLTKHGFISTDRYEREYYKLIKSSAI